MMIVISDVIVIDIVYLTQDWYLGLLTDSLSVVVSMWFSIMPIFYGVVAWCMSLLLQILLVPMYVFIK